MIWIIQTQRKVCRPGWRRSAAPWVESAWMLVHWNEAQKYVIDRMDPRRQIQEMILENESVPEIERLELKEFNVDDERQRMHDTALDEDVSRVTRAVPNFSFFFIRRRFWCKYWAQVKERIEMEILERCYKRDLIKRDCWDSLKVKDRAVKVWKAFSSHLQMTWGVWLIRACQFQAFHTEHEVTNYPLKERPQAEFGALQRVENKRRAEQAVSATLSS